MAAPIHHDPSIEHILAMHDVFSPTSGCWTPRKPNSSPTIVSPSNSSHDRVVELRGYAASGVPIYLLIDPLERVVTLFTEPARGSYLRVSPVPFGEELALPAPCAGVLDTSVFA